MQYLGGNCLRHILFFAYFHLFIFLHCAKLLEATQKQTIYDTVSDVVESNVQFASKILTPNGMD